MALSISHGASMRNIVLGAAAVFAAGAAGAAPANPAASIPAPAASPFAHAQQRVDVGGRRLNLYCSGAGPVTVVFEAGSGDAGWTWQAIQPQVARRTRACVHDRAGLGFSDPSPRQATPENAVADLHALLGKAGVKPPYVLVGHSYGGALAQLYTYRYPDEVEGLVLVEPASEHEFERLNAVSQGRLKMLLDMNAQVSRQCLAQAAKGFAPGSELRATCTAGYDAGGAPPDLAAARLAMLTSATYWRTAVAESEYDQAEDSALRAARCPFGALPLVVLTRGVSPFAVPGQPQSALNKAFEAENRQIHRELAQLSTRGRERVVPGAAHAIQIQQPQAVVAAVDEVLGQVGR
jgi:pimeloyl-ACP methyl ester carboxylesterase